MKGFEEGIVVVPNWVNRVVWGLSIVNGPVSLPVLVIGVCWGLRTGRWAGGAAERSGARSGFYRVPPKAAFI